uniref:Uncharacterized protein n=1 Tax=Daphnia galeata TaxID=27404 RepID=A0A8J2WCE0_9CRUS|nr:unnamed protein product [Daphnia galeata]
MPPTAKTGPSSSTGAPSATVPPRRTRPRQPRPQHTTQEVEVFLPRRARSQPRRVFHFVCLPLLKFMFPKFIPMFPSIPPFSAAFYPSPID